MSRIKIKTPRMLSLILLNLVLATALYGFTPAYAVPESGGGNGSGTIRDYTNSNIDYRLLASDLSKVDSLTLDVAPTASGDTAAYSRNWGVVGTTDDSCTDPDGNNWSPPAVLIWDTWGGSVTGPEGYTVSCSAPGISGSEDVAPAATGDTAAYGFNGDVIGTPEDPCTDSNWNIWPPPATLTWDTWGGSVTGPEVYTVSCSAPGISGSD